MQKNLKSSIKKEKILKNIQRSYDKLLLLEEELERKLQVHKKSQREDIDDFSSEDLSAVSMKITWNSKLDKEKARHIIQNGIDFIETFKKGKDIYRVDQIVADLTKIIRILKAVKDVDEDKIQELEEVRKTLRYITTAKQNADKLMKEVNRKREIARQKLSDERFEQDLMDLDAEYERKKQELAQKYNIPLDLDEKIDQYAGTEEELKKVREYEAEAETNAKRAETEAKDTIRYVRELIKQYYDIPDKIIDELNISIKALGAVATLGKRMSSINIPAEKLREILKDPKIKEILEPYVEEVEFADPVTIVGAKLPKMGTYFAEAQSKIDSIIKDIEEVETEQKEIKEGAVTDAIIKSINIVVSAVKSSFNKVKGVIKSLKNNIFRDGNEIESAINTFNSNHEQRMRDLQMNYLEFETTLSEISIDLVKESVINKMKNGVNKGAKRRIS